MTDEEGEFDDKEYLFYQTPPGMRFDEAESEGLSEKEYALETLERYSGSKASDFQSNLLLTNFPHYVEKFAEKTGSEIFEWAMFKVCHWKEKRISMIDFKIGSPAAALVVDLCSFLPTNAALLLGMCGGLRRRYKVGDYLIPVAGIRDEGTSDYYFPGEVPALSNFLVIRSIIETLESQKIPHHIGITFTTNKRFWEFNETFKTRLKATRAQAIEMECATLFMASYARKFSLGALLLISDLPLNRTGIKTKKMSKHVFENFMEMHINAGIDIILHAEMLLRHRAKGIYNRERYDKK